MKTKRPYAQALTAAEYIVALLAPACERIEIAGSLRRKAAEVGDIEVVAIPRPTFNLLGESDGYSEIDDLLDQPTYVLHKNGPRYKQFGCLAGHVGTSVAPDWYQVDLFLADADNWGYILMLRTGPADFSKAMVTPAPYGLKPPHVRVADGYVWSYPENKRLSVPEEEDLFQGWGIGYISPEERR